MGSRTGCTARPRPAVAAPSDEAALRTAVAVHGPALRARALRVTGGDRGRAEDAVQEVLLRAWRHPAALDAARGSTRAWLLRTLRNVLVDEWRWRSSRAETVTDRPPDVAVPDAADAAVHRQILTDALRGLPPHHRDVLVECFYRGFSVAEAAQRLGVPPGTVKSRTHHALRALRAVLAEPDHPEPRRAG